MFCTKCGAQLADGTKFCTQCGNQISNAAAPAPTPKTAPATPAPKTVTAAPKQKKKKNPAVLIICLVVVLLIGAAAAVYFTGIYEDIIDAVNDIFDKNEKDQDDDIFADEDEDEDEFEATDKTEDSETATTDAPATPDVPDTEETDDYGEAENEYEETVEPEPEVVIVCPECGTECSEEANFCIGCGYSFYGEPETDLSDMYSIWMTDCITKIADTYYTGTSIDVWQARTYKGGFIIGNTYFQHGLGLYSTENSTYTWEFSLPYSAKVLSFYYGIDGLWCYGSTAKYGTARFVIFGSSGNLLFDSGNMHGYDDGTITEPVYVEVDLTGETGLTLSLMTSRGSEGTPNVILGDALVYCD